MHSKIERIPRGSKFSSDMTTTVMFLTVGYGCFWSLVVFDALTV